MEEFCNTVVGEGDSRENNNSLPYVTSKFTRLGGTK